MSLLNGGETRGKNGNKSKKKQKKVAGPLSVETPVQSSALTTLEFFEVQFRVFYLEKFNGGRKHYLAI